MDTISLIAKPDHILKLAGIGDPTRAIIELIWNGLDAEATDVRVELTFDELDGVSGVTVADNGHGMNRQACIQDFSMLGGSWKASALVSPHLKRRMQGRNGQGRLRAFALGNDVHWNTTAEAVTGGMAETTIRGNANNPVNFTVSEDAKVPVAAPSGCSHPLLGPAYCAFDSWSGTTHRACDHGILLVPGENLFKPIGVVHKFAGRTGRHIRHPQGVGHGAVLARPHRELVEQTALVSLKRGGRMMSDRKYSVIP